MQRKSLVPVPIKFRVVSSVSLLEFQLHAHCGIAHARNRNAEVIFFTVRNFFREENV